MFFFFDKSVLIINNIKKMSRPTKEELKRELVDSYKATLFMFTSLKYTLESYSQAKLVKIFGPDMDGYGAHRTNVFDTFNLFVDALNTAISKEEPIVVDIFMITGFLHKVYAGLISGYRR